MAFNLQQQQSSNKGIVTKIKEFLFGKKKLKTQFAPVVKSVDPGFHVRFNQEDNYKHSQKAFRKRRRLANIGFKSRQYNYLHA